MRRGSASSSRIFLGWPRSPSRCSTSAGSCASSSPSCTRCCSTRSAATRCVGGLMTAPGVGAVVALTYRATIDQPQRFAHSRAVGAHVGLTPKRYQSGETDYDGGVSKCGDAPLRTMLYEAAQVLLTHGSKWSWLKAWGMRVAQRRGMRRAIVAVARRLAVVLHRMWVDGSEFRWSKNSTAVPAVA